MISLGHERIAHIAGTSRVKTGLIRRQAFIRSIKKYLPEQPEFAIYEGDFRFESGRSAASEILRLSELPTALVVANDLMALGAMQELKTNGIRIPQDISIVGLDDIAFAALSEPPLTTICSPRVEMGRRAIEALMTSIKIPNQRGMEIRIPTYLIIRESTAPPNK